MNTFCLIIILTLVILSTGMMLRKQRAWTVPSEQHGLITEDELFGSEVIEVNQFSIFLRLHFSVVSG